MLSNYVCAEANLFFLGGRRWAIHVLKLVTLMAIANLIAICLLSRWAFALVKDCQRQSELGVEPIFVASEADLPGVLDGDIWEIPERRPVTALPGALPVRRSAVRLSRVSSAA